MTTATHNKPTRGTDAVANYFGRDGMVMDRVAELLDGCKWIGVPFAGGMGALAALRCNQGVASDLHHHVVNLAAVMADPDLSEELAESLAGVPLHEAVLDMAKLRLQAHVMDLGECVRRDVKLFDGYDGTPGRVFHRAVPDVAWARDYYIVSWMSRGGMAGTEKELDPSAVSVRWKGTGGSSSSRWRTAVASIPGWHDVLKRWSFVCMDAFEFLEQVLKVEGRNVGPTGNGLYLDPPFPDVGEPYVHSFTELHQRRLAGLVAELKHTRVVVRYHDHPLIRELYPESDWIWNGMTSRAQSNGARAEVLLEKRGPS